MPADERAACVTVATRHGIDWRLLYALRETENGAEHLAFGVEDPSADTWDRQAEEAARTIRHTVGRFARNVGAFSWWDDQRGVYSDEFLVYFSRGGQGYDGYAPLHAANDPTGLNANHYPNLAHYYGELTGTLPKEA